MPVHQHTNAPMRIARAKVHNNYPHNVLKLKDLPRGTEIRMVSNESSKSSNKTLHQRIASLRSSAAFRNLQTAKSIQRGARRSSES